MWFMEYRRLAHTDLAVSRVCFGAMTFGSQTGEPAAARMIDMAIEHGVNFFDTANNYNGGLSETILGGVLKGRRDRVILASKVFNKMGDGPDDAGLSRGAVLKQIDRTLERLQTDYLDLYYLHSPDWEAPIEETLEAMDRVVRAGKVRYPASSNYAGWQVAQMIAIAERRGYRPAYVSQPMYNLVARGIEQEYLAMCKSFGVSTVVYNPLAGGLLTGKQHREQPLAGTRFDNNPMYLNRYWHPAYFDAVDRLREAAEQAGRSLVDVSLSWLLHHTPADCVLLGASKVEQLAQNLDAVEKSSPLPRETLSAIDEVWTGLRGVTPKYNR
jgi:aryl-alcohol dehydrogenase-like predicted oxidoreductase